MRARWILVAPVALALVVVLRWATAAATPGSAPPAPSAAAPIDRSPAPPAPAAAGPAPGAPPDAAPDVEPSAAPDAAAPADPEELPRKVYVGVYAFQVPQIALAESNYLVDFWVWFRWKGDFDPTTSFELLNQFEGDIVRTPIYVDDEGNARPDELPDGSRYQVYRIQSRFGRSFDVRDYPFDEQDLTIAFEDNNMTVDEMVYVADADTELVDPGLKVDGWELQKITAAVSTHGYPTSWGDPRRPPGADRYSQFSYTIHLRRPVTGYLASTMIPIAICMVITLSCFFLGAQNFEARLGLATTCMISAVALQLTAQADLPKTGQMVLLDHVYNLSYVTIMITLVATVWAARLHDREEQDAARRVDWVGLVVASVVFFGGCAALIVPRV